MSPHRVESDFYENIIKKSLYVVAPMVEQSELAFRMLCRKLGAHLAYTPMWHAGVFIRDTQYRRDALASCPEDRPLIVQFCANDPETFVQACLLAQDHCDAIDLNLGCPQVIAKRGHYGAFLQEEWHLIQKIISLAVEKVSIPITCKVRVFTDVQRTIEYAKMLEKAGAKLITVHGRTKEQKGPLTGIASWEHIKAVKENVSVPVYANGNIQYLRDVKRCMEFTGVDGVMCAEGLLHNPSIFLGVQPPVWEVADDYLELAKLYNAPLSCVRGHLFRLWHAGLAKHTYLREPLGAVKSLKELKNISDQLKELAMGDAKKDKENGDDSEEPGKLPYWRCQPYVRPGPKPPVKRPHTPDADGEPKIKQLSNKALKKRERQRKRLEAGKEKGGRGKFPPCCTCIVNPKGLKCEFGRCRKCCMETASTENLDCAGHQFKFKSRPRPSKTNKDTKNESETTIVGSEIT